MTADGHLRALLEAGFLFVNEDEELRCYHCNALLVGGWEGRPPGHEPDCPFVAAARFVGIEGFGCDPAPRRAGAEGDPPSLAPSEEG